MRTEPEKSLALVDTNVLIYAYAEVSPKRQRASELLESCFAGNIKLALSFQNLGEFCNIALAKHLLGARTALEKVEEFISCSDYLKLSYSGSTFKKALEIVESHNVSFWDAMLAATMLENGVDVIYTEDNGFEKVPGIKVVNPF